MGTNCVQCSDTGVQCNFKNGVFALIMKKKCGHRLCKEINLRLFGRWL